MAVMTMEEFMEYSKTVSLETVLATINRLSEQNEKAAKEFAEWQAERQKEAAERQAEWQKEVAERQKEAIERQKEAIERQKEAIERQKEAARRHEELEREIQETGRQMKENDRLLTERFRKLAEQSEKSEKRINKLSENIGGLNNSLGSIIETLVAARLWEKFKLYGLDRGFQRVPIFDENGRGVTDIDILLSDTDCAIAVEVKTSLNRKDYVDRHIERMELIRRYPPAEVAINGKRVMGAMAGGVVVPSVMEYAHKCGFFVLELSGESAQLAESPEGFTPTVW